MNPTYHELVASSRLPRPSKFVEQSLAFCKAFCTVLLTHEIVTSDLMRGLSAFDPAVMLDGPEQNYVGAIECLSSYFVSKGWLTASNKVTCVSEYRAFTVKLRLVENIPRDGWIQYLVSHYEMQCRPSLLQVFRFACLCLPPVMSIPTKFDLPIPDLASDKDSYNSAIRSLQLSYSMVPNVSSLYRDTKTICRVFRLLGRGPALIKDRKFSIWDFLKGNVPRRVGLIEKMEGAYKKCVLPSEGLPLFLDMSTPTVSRSPSTSGSPSSGLNLGRVSVSVARCANDGASGSGQKHAAKAGKGSKN